MAPVLIDLVGIRGALIVIGVAPSLIVLVLWRRLMRIDGRVMQQVGPVDPARERFLGHAPGLARA